MKQTRDIHRCDNGLVILGEPMEAVRSAAFTWLLPLGAARLPRACCGAANVILDWLFRGAGSRNSRALNDALDDLGLHRVASVGTAHLTLGAALEAGSLDAALDLYLDVILNPRLDVDEFTPARQLVAEEIQSLDDAPRYRVMLALREQFYPTPLGTPTAGELEAVQGLEADSVAALVDTHRDPAQTILAVAGRYDFEALCRRVEDRWAGAPLRTVSGFDLGSRGCRSTHIPHDGAQVHLGLMTPTVTVADPDYYPLRVALSILSGGMSSRLFTEVREKRGLCYAVDARYHGTKEAAGIACYVGTTPDKAQEARDVIQQVCEHLAEGITDDELTRAKVGLQAALVLQSEASSSRVGSLAGDYYHLGRVRDLDEIKAAVGAVTTAQIVAVLGRHPLHDFTQVTIGPVTVENPS